MHRSGHPEQVAGRHGAGVRGGRLGVGCLAISGPRHSKNRTRCCDDSPLGAGDMAARWHSSTMPGSTSEGGMAPGLAPGQPLPAATQHDTAAPRPAHRRHTPVLQRPGMHATCWRCPRRMECGHGCAPTATHVTPVLHTCFSTFGSSSSSGCRVPGPDAGAHVALCRVLWTHDPPWPLPHSSFTAPLNPRVPR